MRCDRRPAPGKVCNAGGPPLFRFRTLPLVSNLLNRFSLHANWSNLDEIALLFIWVCVVACVISSILSQPFGQGQRVFWIILVIVLPVFGILAYLPFAFRKENLPHVFLRHKKHPRKIRDQTNTDPEP